MCILVFANLKDELFYQKFLSEQDMYNFLDENDDIIFIGSRILN